MEQNPIDDRKANLIRSTEDPCLQEDVRRYALKITNGNLMDTEDYTQESIARFISQVNLKKELEELNPMDPPLPYLRVIVRNMHIDKHRKMSRPTPQEKTASQMDLPQSNPSEKPRRQKYELLETQMRESVEDIAHHQQREGKIGLTNLGMEEYAVSDVFVEKFINSLPEELRELARFLIFEEYQLKELTQILRKSYDKLKDSKARIRAAWIGFINEQSQ